MTKRDAKLPELPRVSRTRSVASTLLFSAVSLCVTFVQGLVLPPLYLRSMPTAVYGAWLAVANVIAWLELTDPGLSTVFGQRLAMALGSRDVRRLQVVLGTGLALALSMAVLPLVGLPFASWVVQRAGAPPNAVAELATAYRLGVLALTTSLVGYVANAAVQSLHLTVRGGLASVLGHIFGLAATGAALQVGWGVISLPLGLLVRAAAMVLFGGVALTSWWVRQVKARPVVSTAELKSMLAPSAMTFAGRAGGLVLGSLDALVAAMFFGPSSAAVLVLTGKLFELVRMPLERTCVALAPSVTHLFSEKGGEATIGTLGDAQRASRMIAIVGVAVAALLNGAFVTLWVGEDKYGGAALTLAFAASTVMASDATFWSQALVAVGGFRAAAGLALAEGALRLPMLAGLGWLAGLPGMVLAAALAMLAVRVRILPRLTARQAGVPADAVRPAWLETGVAVGLLAGTSAAVLGMAGYWSDEWTWFRLMSVAVACAVGFSGVVLVADQALRARLLLAWQMLRPGGGR